MAAAANSAEENVPERLHHGVGEFKSRGGQEQSLAGRKNGVAKTPGLKKTHWDRQSFFIHSSWFQVLVVAGYLKDFCCNQLGQELKVAEKKYEELQAEAEKVQPTVGMRKKAESHNYLDFLVLKVRATTTSP